MDKSTKDNLTEIAKKSIDSIRSGKSAKSRSKIRRQYLAELRRIKTALKRRKAIDFYNQITKVLIQDK